MATADIKVTIKTNGKGRPTPKRTTPARAATDKHALEELLGKPAPTVSSAYKNKRRAKNRLAKAGRRANRR
jgi:hypothetical protein